MDPSFRPPQPLVWINGWPAIGKQSVAQCLAQFLGPDRAIIIDDCEFTDMLKLTPEAKMARPTGRTNTGRCRGLSVSDLNKKADGDSSAVFTPPTINKCPEKGCDGKECPNKDCRSKTSVVRECVGGRLIAADDETSLAVKARQEACFRKFVLDIDDPASAPVVKPDVKGILKAKPSNYAAKRFAKLQKQKPVTNMQKFIIFTDCRVDNEAGAEGAWRYANVAKEAKRPFIPIYVECMPEEHARRAQSSDRIYGHPSGAAITGADAARELQAVSDGRLFTFPQDEIPGLYINVTSQGIHSLAMEILSFITAVLEKRSGCVKKSVDAAIRKRPGSSVNVTAEK
ncbi:hypothetical protein SBRCBS47491_002471 [Sporothrix bragantina]|uniref:Uncharacterized protein n=1 Tax=Sporothrix bragantina TaxID=671064 RepID=A0ABP0B7X1_9PEZI